MFEHVGINHYRTFFDTVYRALTPDGVALLHSIGRLNGPGRTNSWIRKYIVPGGYAPAPPEVLPIIERSGLLSTDIELLRIHYAMTIDHWTRRFQANRAEIAQLYEERFCRMWEFYLADAEMDFPHLNAIVFQLQLAKRIDAVPLTRDYIAEWKARAGKPWKSAPRETPTKTSQIAQAFEQKFYIRPEIQRSKTLL